jgi:hypothetical protein
MTPYYQDNAVTIYHGENKSCGEVCGMVDCNHEKTHTHDGGGKTGEIQEAQSRRACCQTKAGSAQWLCSERRTRGQAHPVGGRASRMEREQGQRQGGPFSCSAGVPFATVFGVREGSFGAAPQRWKHVEQRAEQHCVCMSEVPHGKGWAS